MRLGVGVVLCLLALSLGVSSGCRKPLTPNIERNEAPETWISGAPLDTLTLLDEYGQPINDPEPTVIPVSFHLYWAGSDRDGAVVGFYYAVVETTATPAAPLPGPMPGQYRFTTKTDSTFIFAVSELFDRDHAFFIYAVDNQGKSDATPARFIFTATDKFPPRPVLDLARATGETVRLDPSGEPVSELLSYPRDPLRPDFTDTLGSAGPPRDTVPAFSRLDFRWHGEITQPGTFVTNYKYKLDELEFLLADSSVHAVSYGLDQPGSPPVSTGLKVFMLRALDQAGGAGQTTRRFVMNFVPDTWWAGPDPADFTGPSDGEYDSHSVDVIRWPSRSDPVFITNPPLPAGSTFGPDSFDYRPSRRLPPNRDFFGRQGRTFYEIYKDRLYARTDGDTIHMNSFIILWNGGYDKDSRYIPRADSTDPWLRDPDGALVTGAVLQAAGRVGSPIGFRSLVATRLTPNGVRSIPAWTSMYPNYEPASVFRSPRIGGYWRMYKAGKAYALARSEDADGGLDNSFKNADVAMALADRVDEGGGTPQEDSLRRKVLVFHVNKAPALVRTGSPPFLPYENQSIGTSEWSFNLRGLDLDPFDPGLAGFGGGGPTPKTIIRYKITLYGLSLAGRDTFWTYLAPNGLPYIHALGEAYALNFIPGGTMAANPFASGQIRVSIQICDCIDCETVPGQGRCVDGIDPLTRPWQVPDRPGFTAQNVITVNYTRPASEPDLGTASSTAGRPGPDPTGRKD
jgi:hypothetical protein